MKKKRPPLPWQRETLRRAAAWHVAKLLGMVACAAVLCVVIERFADHARWIGAGVKQQLSSGCVILGLALVAMYVSLSALWGVLGTGSWWLRMTGIWLIFHLAIIASVQAAAALGLSDPMSWRVKLAYVAGTSYALTGQVLVFMFLTWLLKAMRWRLIYLHDPASYPHPREGATLTTERSGSTLLSNRLSLLDLLILTTLIAAYLGAWKPLMTTLPDDTFFGPGFLFVVVIAGLSMGAIATLVVFLLTCVTMQDRWGKRVQLAVHGLLFVGALVTAIAFCWFFAEPEQYAAVGIGLATLLGVQLLLYGLHRKPSPQFRFRLVIIKKPSRLIGGSNAKAS
ncbi:hypothetical protein [Roseimaritima ulvae]|uniref:Uncharacterized protein n=1 Tax=Roseimaritima ulvae TaxID=980254 RepID=A0A5B9QNY7_9BACT|nr:hypothetical protein [Roseimaritima ulvae]QEG38726.1 hypothetical protein UC8_06840 [Roseimaritima ulvae]